MALSAPELARLDVMLDVSQLQSDPPVLSDTDRTIDALRAVSAPRKARPDNLDDRTLSRPAVAGECEDKSEWDAHRSLDELIEIRRALMRNRR